MFPVSRRRFLIFIEFTILKSKDAYFLSILRSWGKVAPLGTNFRDLLKCQSYPANIWIFQLEICVIFIFIPYFLQPLVYWFQLTISSCQSNLLMSTYSLPLSWCQAVLLSPETELTNLRNKDKPEEDHKIQQLKRFLKK